ncbi:MAG: hypothetical protein AABY64_13065 [Bdellovibrionota bacterium]
MRKFLVSLVTVISLINFSPKKSEAAVGVILLPHLIGVPFIVAGAFVTLASLAPVHQDHGTAWLTFWFGIFLMDGEKGTDVVFTELKSDEARQLGLSDVELSSYNEELPEINAIREHIVGTLTTRVSLGQDVDQKLARNLWQANGTQLSPTAFSALKKVSGQTPILQQR